MKRIISLISIFLVLIFNTVIVTANSGVTVTICVFEHVTGKYLLETRNVVLDDGATALDALKKSGLTVKTNGSYVTAVDEYAEFAYGKKSGWVYYINDDFPNIPASKYRLNSGDSVRWEYVIDEAETSISAVISTTIASVTQKQVEPDTLSADNASPTVRNDAMTGTSQTLGVQSMSKTAVSLPAESSAVSNSKSEAVQTKTDMIYSPDAVSDALKTIKSEPTSFTPLALSLYMQAIPDSIKESVTDEAESDMNALAAARLIINADAIGIEVTDEMYDSCFNSDEVDKTGINGIIFALLAACRCDLSDGPKNTAEVLEEMLIGAQNPDGGFPLDYGGISECDLTAMAITALSSSESEAAKSSIDLALEYLSSIQNNDGSFSLYGTVNCESTAQVVIALSSAGISQSDKRFVKTRSAYEALYDFYKAGSGFSHTLGGDTNSISCEQALLAIYSVQNDENPYIKEVTAHINEINFPLIFGICAAAVAVSAVMLFILTRKNSKKVQKPQKFN